jgi:hypothetical protein
MVVILEGWTLRMSMPSEGRSALSGLGFQAWWSAQKIRIKLLFLKLPLRQ